MPTEGYGAIFLEDKGKLEFVLNLDDTATYQNYVLQPGHYRVVYRRRGANETLYTIEKPFVIESSKSVALNLR
jgi:Ca-activated chloride channel family protein